MKSSKKQERVSILLEPIKAELDTFITDILNSANDTEDIDRKTALLLYATAIQSFINDGHWRRNIVHSVRWLQALRKSEEVKDGRMTIPTDIGSDAHKEALEILIKRNRKK